MQFIKKNKLRYSGVTTLIMVISFSSVLLSLSLTSSVLAFWLNQTMYSYNKSLRTYYASYSGLQDALIKLERNKDFQDLSGFPLSINDVNDVSVTVENNDSSATITSLATFKLVNKKLQTIVDINTTSGLITPTSTSELAL